MHQIRTLALPVAGMDGQLVVQALDDGSRAQQGEGVGRAHQILSGREWPAPGASSKGSGRRGGHLLASGWQGTAPERSTRKSGVWL
ncbi:hypothetical protein GCM10027160_28810 [Streptomyces calidiresistens]